MNLLIPTNDGISISPDFDAAKKFRFLSVINGSVIKDEIRISKNVSEIEFYSRGKETCNNNSVKDDLEIPEMKHHYQKIQNIVIVNSISKETEKKLNDNNFEVLLTSETNITNAILYFIKYHSTCESDYCCSP
jgi:predicted Fe-Mo cluster-binding NifX family protein